MKACEFTSVRLSPISLNEILSTLLLLFSFIIIITLKFEIMKQVKLVVTVYDKDGNVVFSQDPANVQNVQSCIDLWHESGTEICLAFREVVLSEDNNSNS